MNFLSSKIQYWIFWPGYLVVVSLTKFSILNGMALTSDSFFSGILALTGFIFTARTFITFKLNEVIYENPKYRSLVEQLQVDQAYHKKLYDPLRNLDYKLNITTHMCLWSTALFLVASFFPKPLPVTLANKVVLDSVYLIFLNMFRGDIVITSGIITTVASKILRDFSIVYFLRG